MLVSSSFTLSVTCIFFVFSFLETRDFWNGVIRKMTGDQGIEIQKKDLCSGGCYELMACGIVFVTLLHLEAGKLVNSHAKN